MTWLAYSHLGVAKTVQLTTQPAGSLAGIPFSVQPVGRLVDGSGVLSRATGVTVTASKASGTGTLSGTLSVQTVEGVFTFTDLKMDTVTSAVTLQFASSGLTSAVSNAFNVTQPNTIIGIESGTFAVTGTAAGMSRTRVCQCVPGSYVITGTSVTLSGAATNIVVTTQPAGAVSAVAFTTQPVVQLRNAAGSNVAESGVTVTAYLSSGSGTLGGTKTATTNASGTATFTNLSITGSGSHTVSFYALMSQVQTVWSDDVETNRSSSYFEVDTAGGAFGRASVDGSMQWRSVQSGAGPEFGNLKLGIGRTPSGVTSVGPSGVDFGKATMECDIYHSANNLTNAQDKCLRMSVFADSSWSQAACAHIWSDGGTVLKIDPVTSVVNGAVTAVGWNDFAHFTWTGASSGATTLFGATATTPRRLKVVWTLDAPGQNNGTIQMYLDDVLELQQTGLNLRGTYTAYGINAVHWENFRTGGVTTANNRMYDDLAVSGQAQAIVAANSLTIGIGEPQPEDGGVTILADYRAGGNRDLQAVTTLGQMIALFDDSNQQPSGPYLTLDVDGAGTNAIRSDWLAGGNNDPEQENYLQTDFTPFASGSLIVWSKFHLGRTATGGGIGSIGAFALNAAHSNPHLKKWLIQRANNNLRIYMKVYPTEMDFQIDNNNFDSVECSDTITTLVGQTQTLTTRYTLPNRIECWLNGVLVFDRSDCDLGTSNYTAVQTNATMLVPEYDMSEYLWDIVIGRTP